MRHFLPETSPEPDLALRRAQTGTMLDLGLIQAMIGRRAQGLFDDEGLDDITPGQANVLMVLYQAKEPLTARAVCGSMGCREATMSRLLDKLDKNEWVRRVPDPKDARARLVSLTPKAREALPRFIRVTNQLLDETFVGFSRAEIEWIAAATHRIRENLG